MNYPKEITLYYDNSKDLYEGLIIEDDNGVQNQVGYIFPAFRDKYGVLFASAPEMYEALKSVNNMEVSPDESAVLVIEALAKAEGQ